MTAYADLTPCTYFPGEIDSSEPLLAVGWLERDQPYTRGTVAEPVLDALVAALVHPWEPGMFMGWHDCSLCEHSRGPLTLEYKGKRVEMGISNLFVPGRGCVYVAPSLILHYIDTHEYAPPAEFCEAVLACPPMRSDAYFRALPPGMVPHPRVPRHSAGFQSAGTPDRSVRASGPRHFRASFTNRALVIVMCIVILSALIVIVNNPTSTFQVWGNVPISGARGAILFGIGLVGVGQWAIGLWTWSLTLLDDRLVVRSRLARTLAVPYRTLIGIELRRVRRRPSLILRTSAPAVGETGYARDNNVAGHCIIDLTYVSRANRERIADTIRARCRDTSRSGGAGA